MCHQERPVDSHAVALLGVGIIDRIVRRECMCCIVFSILAHLMRRSWHGVIINKIHVPDSACGPSLMKDRLKLSSRLHHGVARGHGILQHRIVWVI
jgi:hypothetical protein